METIYVNSLCSKSYDLYHLFLPFYVPEWLALL